MNPIEISVIIPAYNASATIGRALEALASQDYPKPYEVIVVDDGSTDNTSQVVHGFSNVHYVSQDNAGPAAARNHGARLAKGEFLAFTDSDCVPHHDWLSRLMAGFTGDEVTVVAGSYGIANPENLLAQGVHREIIFRHHVLMPDFPKAFGSYNFCARKNAFQQVGGFNEEYRQASGEDNDLSYKFIGADCRIYFQRDALVDHYHSTSPVKYLKEQFRHGFWRVGMYADHAQMAGGDGYTFWKDIAEVPIAGVCLLGLVLSALHIIGFGQVLWFLWVPFLVFEILSGCFLMRDIFKGFFFGFILFLRAFARTLGFSTGILAFFLKVMEKKSK